MMTKKDKKQQPPPRRCIFCNLPGKLTRQHIFSDFLRHYITRNKQGSTHLRSDTDFGPAISSTPHFTAKKDQGDMGVKKLLLVCEICNSGWISENENNIKEIIGKLVLGEQIGLEDNLISKIATWIAVMTIMGEFMEPDETRDPQKSSKLHLQKIDVQVMDGKFG